MQSTTERIEVSIDNLFVINLRMSESPVTYTLDSFFSSLDDIVLFCKKSKCMINEFYIFLRGARLGISILLSVNMGLVGLSVVELMPNFTYCPNWNDLSQVSNDTVRVVVTSFIERYMEFFDVR